MSNKIAVVDDDQLFRAGLVRLLDTFTGYKVVQSWANSEFLEQIGKQPKVCEEIDILIMCSPYFLQSKFVKNESLIQCFSGRATMILSNQYSKSTVLRCFELGISAFFSRDISPKELESILNGLINESDYSTIQMESKIKAKLTQMEPVKIDLSEAEEEVLRLVCHQKSSAEISEQLGISVRTVESRKRKMIKKTASKNMIGVIMAYFKSREGGTFLVN